MNLRMGTKKKESIQRRLGVLTGDFVDSSGYGVRLRSRITEDLKTFTAEVAEEGMCYPPIVIFRGDSWQLATPPSFYQLIRMAVLIRTAVRAASPKKKCDTRIGMSIGRYEAFVPGEAESYQGEVFEHSGMALDGLPKKRLQRMAFQGTEPPETAPEGGSPVLRAAVVVILLDHMIRQWTPSQCQAVHHTLRGKTQARIGKGWGQSALGTKAITKVAVGQHLKAADYNALESALRLLEPETGDPD